MAKQSKGQFIAQGFEDLMPADTRGKLQEKFLVPPFSILDTKQGYWQDRKRQWISLGIKSEIGRGSNLTITDPRLSEQQLNHYREKEKAGHSIIENGMHSTPAPVGKGGLCNQLAPLVKQHETISREAVAFKSQDTLNAIMKDKSGARDKIEANSMDKADKGWKKSPNSLGNVVERFATGETVTESVAKIAGIGTGTSIFDPVLCELMYKWFCVPGGTILDPFAGGSVRGIVAATLGYKYCGVDLSTRQIEANREQAKELVPDNQPTWIEGNSVELYDILPEEPDHFDFVFSCPPYHDLEQYTDHMDDLSNMSWESFKKDYNNIIEQVVMKLKDNRFACFVVSEIRNEAGFFKGFVPYTVQCFKNAGMEFYNEIILVNVVGSLPVRVANCFGGNRKIGRMHQNVLVFYKGDPDTISSHYGTIETGDINKW